jgi:exosome complex exonuclease DIS3/RRP44
LFSLDTLVALKDDDADDEGGEETKELDEEAVREKKEAAEAAEVAKKNPLEKQPTGRVVGVFKRNWRP